MQIKKELIKRSIAGDTILVPVGQAIYDSNGLFALNEVGTFLWDRIGQAENEEALVAAVLDAYEVSPETARQDVAEFLGELVRLGIL